MKRLFVCLMFIFMITTMGAAPLHAANLATNSASVDISQVPTDMRLVQDSSKDKKCDVNSQNLITKVKNGYMLAIPSKIADKVKEGQNVKLTLLRGKKADSSVQGRLKRVSGGLLLTSREILDTPLDRPGFGIVLHDPDTQAGSCGSAEFGIGCFFAAPCAGTEYCLPGNGPGGFTCQCL